MVIIIITVENERILTYLYIIIILDDSSIIKSLNIIKNYQRFWKIKLFRLKTT